MQLVISLYLRQQVTIDLISLAKSQSNDNPVYYAQYAHARMCSIERQAKQVQIDVADHFELLVHPKEIELVKHINEFRNEIIESAKQRAPHKITNYIQKLAQCSIRSIMIVCIDEKIKNYLHKD